MVAFDESELNDAKDVDTIDGDCYVEDGLVLQKLVESFRDVHDNEMLMTVQALNRAFQVRTSDLVGGDNMVGAKVTFVDTDGDLHRAIVVEPEVAGMSAAKAYDPHKDEMVDPSNYPMGTVNLVHAKEGSLGGDDSYFSRLDDLVMVTSVTPARKPDTTYCYYAGWDYHDSQMDEE